MNEEVKVSELAEASVVNDDDILMLVQNGTNKKVDVETLFENIENEINTKIQTNITTNSERATNEYVNGERVYVKRIDLGAFPNNTSKTVTHGISSPIIVRSIIVANNGAGTYQDMSHRPNFSSYITTTAIVFNPGGDYSSWTGYADLYYTK